MFYEPKHVSTSSDQIQDSFTGFVQTYKMLGWKNKSNTYSDCCGEGDRPQISGAPIAPSLSLSVRRLKTTHCKSDFKFFIVHYLTYSLLTDRSKNKFFSTRWVPWDWESEVSFSLLMSWNIYLKLQMKS